MNPAANYTLSLMVMALSVFSLQGQESRVRIMFYNVENLFDTLDDPTHNDDEFLPGSDRRWDNYRFHRKLNNIARVIIGVGEWQAPGLAGLCEVENRYVLNQLIYNSPLKTFGYRVIHAESPDHRGIDVALLYREKYFAPDTVVLIPVWLPDDTSLRTRDILHVRGRIASQDTLHLFVNHWPSRYGGFLNSMPGRVRAARLLRARVDSLFRLNPSTGIVILGDFNDGPGDESIWEILKALPDAVPGSDSVLVNLMYPFLRDRSIGTLKYGADWNVFDQVIVSGSLFNPLSPLRLDTSRSMIYRAGFLLENDEKYLGKKPFRTYQGYEYKGGYSDHLPVYFDLITSPAAPSGKNK